MFAWVVEVGRGDEDGASHFAHEVPAEGEVLGDIEPAAELERVGGG